MSFGCSILAKSLAWLALCLSIAQSVIVPDCPCRVAGNCSCVSTGPAKPHVPHKARRCCSHACHGHKPAKNKAGMRLASASYKCHVRRAPFRCPPTCSCHARQLPSTSLPVTEKDNRSFEIASVSVHVAFEVPAAEATKVQLFDSIDHLAGSSRHLSVSLCRLII